MSDRMRLMQRYHMHELFAWVCEEGGLMHKGMHLD